MPILDPSLLEESADDLYERAVCGYLTFNSDGVIVKVNQTLLGWLGYKPGDVVDKKKFQDLLGIGGRIFYETHIGPLLRMQGYANEIYFDLLCSDKSRLPVLTTMVQRQNIDKSSTVYRLTLFNIADRRKYERELISERDKAHKALRAKSEFLSLMSHEIRTPMNAVIGIANLLKTTQLSSTQSEYISLLNSSAENLMGLLNNILDFSKAEAGKVTLSEKPANLKALVLESVRSLEGKALEKGLRLDLTFDDTLPEGVVVDRVKLGQILSNFIGNAIKFTEKGSVGVEVGCLDRGRDECVIGFKVIDSGIGIAEDRLARIFEEFSQADSDIALKYGGSGLGLAICSKLAELLGGRIQVKSQVGLGSEFSIELNLKTIDLPKESAEVKPDATPIKALSGLHLLIADDNDANIYILKHLLKSWPVSCEFASNGIEVLRKLEESSFDILLLDLRMPLMDGFTTARKIRQSESEGKPKLPIIAFSASSRAELSLHNQLADFDDCLSKPFSPADLLQKLLHHTKRDVHLGSQESTSTHVDQEESSLFSLEFYRESLEDDEEALVEIIALVIEGLAEAKEAFAKAMISGDAANFEFFAHRIQSSIEMLKARSLQSAIREARSALAGETPSENVSLKLALEMDLLVSGLRKVIAQI